MNIFKAVTGLGSSGGETSGTGAASTDRDRRSPAIAALPATSVTSAAVTNAGDTDSGSNKRALATKTIPAHQPASTPLTSSVSSLNTNDPAEVVARVLSRIESSTLPKDKHDAIRSLRALVRDYPECIGSDGLETICEALYFEIHQQQSQNLGVIENILEIFIGVFAPGVDSQDEIDAISEWVKSDTRATYLDTATNDATYRALREDMSRTFLEDARNVTLLCELIANHHFKIRHNAVRLFILIAAYKTQRMQECLLETPNVFPTLVEILEDARDIVRYDAILGLIVICKHNMTIQKTLAFQNTFFVLLKLIETDGGYEGSLEVEDSLVLLIALIENNVSNLKLFVEDGYVKSLISWFDFMPKPANGGAGGGDAAQNPDTKSSNLPQGVFSMQESTNLRLMLKFVRVLVGSTSDRIVDKCRDELMRRNVLQKVCQLLVSVFDKNSVTDITYTIATIIRGHKLSQDYFEKMTSPRDGQTTIFSIILQVFDKPHFPFEMKMASLQLIHALMYRNDAGIKMLLDSITYQTSESAADNAHGAPKSSSTPRADKKPAFRIGSGLLMLSSLAQQSSSTRNTSSGADNNLTIHCWCSCQVLLHVIACARDFSPDYYDGIKKRLLSIRFPPPMLPNGFKYLKPADHSSAALEPPTVRAGLADDNFPGLLQLVCSIAFESTCIQSQLAALQLLIALLHDYPPAVRALLALSPHNNAVPYMLTILEESHNTPHHVLSSPFYRIVQGLCAFLLGICIAYNKADDVSELQQNGDSPAAAQQQQQVKSPYSLRQLIELVRARLSSSSSSLVDKLQLVSTSDYFNKALKRRHFVPESARQLCFSHEFCSLYRGIEEEIRLVLTSVEENHQQHQNDAAAGGGPKQPPKLSELVRRCDKLESTLTQRVQQCNEMDQQLAALRNSLNQREQELSRLHAEHEGLKRDAEILRTEKTTRGSTESTSGDAEQRLAALRAEHDQLQQTYQQAYNNMLAYQQAFAQLKSVVEAGGDGYAAYAAQLQEQNVQLQARVDEYTLYIGGWQRESAKWQQAYAAANEQLQRFASTSQQNDNLVVQQTLQAVANGNATTVDELNRLNEALQKELDVKNAELSQAEQRQAQTANENEQTMLKLRKMQDDHDELLLLLDEMDQKIEAYKQALRDHGITDHPFLSLESPSVVEGEPPSDRSSRVSSGNNNNSVVGSGRHRQRGASPQHLTMQPNSVRMPSGNGGSSFIPHMTDNAESNLLTTSAVDGLQKLQLDDGIYDRSRADLPVEEAHTAQPPTHQHHLSGTKTVTPPPHGSTLDAAGEVPLSDYAQPDITSEEYYADNISRDNATLTRGSSTSATSSDISTNTTGFIGSRKEPFTVIDNAEVYGYQAPPLPSTQLQQPPTQQNQQNFAVIGGGDQYSNYHANSDAASATSYVVPPPSVPSSTTVNAYSNVGTSGLVDSHNQMPSPIPAYYQQQYSTNTYGLSSDQPKSSSDYLATALGANQYATLPSHQQHYYGMPSDSSSFYHGGSSGDTSFAIGGADPAQQPQQNSDAVSAATSAMYAAGAGYRLY